MQHRLATLATIAIAALALSACDGATVLEPAAAGARFTDNQCPPGEVCWEEPPGDTTTAPMVAEYRYYSDIPAGTEGIWKKVRMYAVSQSYRYVASSTLDARFHRDYGCLSQSATPTQVDRVTRSGSGSPLKLEASHFVQYTSEINTFTVKSTHSFTPIPNATGGGSFNSSWRRCY